MTRTFMTPIRVAATGVALTVVLAQATFAGDANDNLNATLWTQRSMEFKATALGAYALARIRLDEALADRNWTAAPGEQTGNYQDLPPAVILDVDETVLDNSLYQGWMVKNHKSFSGKTWQPFVNTVSSRPVPGSLEFIRYAHSKGVKIFYVSNRKANVEEATRKNLEMFGYPLGGNVDTVLLRKERDGWGSKKGTRRAHVAADYRVLLLMGDNLGDFVDGYKQSVAERNAILEANAERWGKSWIMIANPTYGSWEQNMYEFNYKLSGDDKRSMKVNSLEAWPGPQ